MRRNVRKRTFGRGRPVKIQMSLRIREVWSESSLGAFGIANETTFLYADNKDAEQIARMRRLIWVFYGARLRMHVFSCRLKWSKCVSCN